MLHVSREFLDILVVDYIDYIDVCKTTLLSTDFIAQKVDGATPIYFHPVVSHAYDATV